MARNRLEPSSKQIEMLHCIYSYWKHQRICPTIREIGSAIGMRSSSTVNYNLIHLERLGCLVRHTRRSRALVLTEKAFRYLNTGDAPADEVSLLPDHLLEELQRLRSENAQFKGLKLNPNVMEQLHNQRERMAQRYRERIWELERERDQLIDENIRLRMRSAS